MLALRTSELTKHYRIGFWRPRPYVALDHVSLEVKQGEVFGFLGPNGAGKTTMLKLLMQLIFPTFGTAEIMGRPVGDLEVRRQIGYLPENPVFYDNLSAEELLGYFGSLFGYAGADRRARVARLLDEVGLGAERRLQLRKYSKGMVQRVGLAQALLNDPAIVFLDEPMSGLDPLGRREVRDIILKLRDRGTTVFFSSHILSDAESLCSSVAIVAAGRLVAQGSVAELVPFRIREWELVIANLAEPVLAQFTPRVSRMTPLGGARYQLVVPGDTAPESLIADLNAAGGRLISLNPVRQTLEDFFVQTVRESERRDFV
jgi:ABC-2 type transport system ATP-binding protein